MRGATAALLLGGWHKWASAGALAGTVAAFTGPEVLIVLCMSVFCGAASLANELRKGVPERLVAFVLAHMLMAIVAGFVAFVAGERAKVDGLTTTLGIIFASLGGSQLLAKVGDKWLPKGLT